jgi:hypothetical protein
MIRRKFAIGQIVDFDARVMPRPSGPFEVVRALPAENANSPTYRIKSKSEPFERSVKEYEIVAVDLPLTERAAKSTPPQAADPMRGLEASWLFRSR